MDDDVLKFVLRGHLLDCYEWIYFPYLLEAIAHAAPRNPATDEFVVRGLAMAAERIHKNRKGFRHRHHGVRLMLRSCTRSALLLVAASRAAGGCARYAACGLEGGGSGRGGDVGVLEG